MTNTQQRNVPVAAVVVALVFAIIGVGFYLAEHLGFIASNLSDAAPWGIYLSFFMLFAGIGAGCLIMAAVPSALGTKALDMGLRRELSWTAFAALLVAGVFITIDLGNPLRMLELLVAPHPSSPLFWDVLALPVAIIAALACALAKKLSNQRAWNVFVLVWGVFVLCVDAWILCSQPAHATWHTALLLPWFVVTGVLCGAAVEVMFAVWAKRKTASASKMAAALVLCDALLFFFDLLCGGETTRSLYLVGSLAPLFWAQMVLYAVAFVIFAVPKLHSGKLLCIASTCALLGVAAKRVALMTSGFQVPAFDLPLIVQSSAAPVYTPAATEIVCAVGIVGLCVLVVLLGLKYIDFAENDN